MSNGIAVRQNEEKAIAMLAAQRQLYNDAKKFGTISVILSIWLPFAMALILLFLPEESIWKSVSYILAIVSMLFSFVVDKHIADKKKLAAFIQQKFDVYVYNMPWNERIFGKDKNVNQDIVACSKQIIEKADEKNACIIGIHLRLIIGICRLVFCCVKEKIFGGMWDLGKDIDWQALL